jgi:hypothetical protein
MAPCGRGCCETLCRPRDLEPEDTGSPLIVDQKKCPESLDIRDYARIPKIGRVQLFFAAETRRRKGCAEKSQAKRIHRKRSAQPLCLCVSAAVFCRLDRNTCTVSSAENTTRTDHSEGPTSHGHRLPRVVSVCRQWQGAGQPMASGAAPVATA